MLVLFDNNVDRRFAALLEGHEVKTAYEMGWASFKNGSLIQVAEEAGFTVMLTADKNLSYQQSLAGRRISIIIFGSIFTDFSGIRSLAPQVLRVLDDLPQGSFIVVKPD